MKIRKAWEALTEAMAKDHDFAWGVQCNIAVTIMDRSESSHRDSNIAAAEIMQTLFGYDVTGLYNYRDIMTKDLEGPKRERLIKLKLADNVQPSVNERLVAVRELLESVLNTDTSINLPKPSETPTGNEPKLTDNAQPSVSRVMPNGVGVSKTDIGHILPTTGEVNIIRAEINPDLVLEDHPELTHS